MGNELIVCGVYDPSNVIGDPVPSVESLVRSLSANNETLAGIPIIVKPFSLRPNAPPTTSCYLRLHSQFDVTETEGVDAEPRCDLLHEWMVALQSARPQWEIRWASQKAGRDKRSWIRFTNLTARGAGTTVPKETLDKIKSYLCGHGFPVLDHFTNDGGSVFVLADPSHVDQILAQEELNVPSVGPDKLRVTRARQIVVENAFELVVTGTTDYDSLIPYLTRWLRNRFTDGEATRFLAKPNVYA
jgi:hypothetical protein